ncbi:ATP-dependent RNA helicase DbpA [Lujinxingia vulgaris]|uniref:ATP-dependent RNA helicase DbpA n=1 Tax=Lujinxingia vulgaris TaxID=2600176 RepID=A0A5C6XEJ4_9DELT|nr:ATP-dependent RNA helicase DbpA [Lujinxingia vulgaris]TXD37243.1 ATP-dependent RNA helicase DbpA [Lujinxingia vulgaris]
MSTSRSTSSAAPDTAPFATLSIENHWLETLDQLGYHQMTPIQAATLPLTLRGQDVVGLGSTGTGKTAAFGLALLHRVSPAQPLPQALVLCPTRELASQVTDELRRLARALPNTQILTVTGGAPFSRQRVALEHGVDVVVATPGRLLDHLDRETIDLSRVKTLVFDEADRLLDMGFLDDVATIAEACPTRRQTLLFSATFPRAIRELSERFQLQARQISVVGQAERPDIDQVIVELGDVARLDALESVLQNFAPTSSVIFCNQRDTCETVVERLQSAGYSAETLHGGMEQRDRETTLLRLSNGSLRHLVATNVAARGLDIDALDAVINFELPREAEAFVHRVGRTGRAGEQGLAITLVGPEDSRKLPHFKDHLADARQVTASTPSPSAPPPPAAANMTVAIKGGRKDKLRPGDIVGALTRDFGFEADAIGDIQIQNHIAFVALRRDIAGDALRQIQDGQIKGRRFRAFMQR